ncbi:MAG: hypothetical protein K2K52_05200 [Paramuribaculum sp.]|nr:hypothetical protein [Paramuribaculum sp.]
MREFFMTSTIPYWLLFILGIASVGYSTYIAFKTDEHNPISKQTVNILTGIFLLVGLAVIVLYNALGGNALWWITGKDIGYGAKLLRVIPLVIFLAAEVVAPFAYKLMMEVYLDDKRLSVKTQFIALLVIVPVAIIVSIFAGNIWFYIIAGVGTVGAAVYSATSNVNSTGAKTGLAFTVISFILCASALVTLLYLVVAFFSLILEMLPVIATIIGVSIIFGKSYGNAVMRRDNAGNYIANDGSKHSSQSSRDTRDQQIRTQRNS